MESSFDPRHPDFIEDPFPALLSLMEHEPVFWSEKLHGWVLTRHEHVRASLRDPRLSADRVRPFLAHFKGPEREAVQSLVEGLSMWASFNEPPVHTRLRSLMNKAMTLQSILALEPRVRALADELIDAALERGEMDVIADFAYPLSATMIAELFGVPRADVPLLKKWSDELGAFIVQSRTLANKYAIAAGGLRAMTSYFEEVVAERRRRPREDMLSRLIAAEEQGDFLSAAELFACCALLFFAGHETTTHLIGNGMIALLRHPKALAELRERRADTTLMSSAIEEMLRWDGPLLMMARVASEDVELSGKRILAGSRVFLMIAAANRDPRVFPDPARFDIHRQDNRHIAFGNGIHYCIGAPLARLEARVAFPRLLERLSEPALATSKLVWRDAFVVRGVEKLPIRFARPSSAPEARPPSMLPRGEAAPTSD
ncbi:cytochrome P450 [Polyangium sp. y55x31]|uniref:cytochrome P450 n=1 Tax=Polyangium sp. y55x31 TaxID=3042688 RepID=UPI0024829C54|nr:cytochrome P450 [Polyangium sp. y55x31]MDI1475756.1 cytochrome P450 [Polyangium sp. y55x31]